MNRMMFFVLLCFLVFSCQEKPRNEINSIVIEPAAAEVVEIIKEPVGDSQFLHFKNNVEGFYNVSGSSSGYVEYVAFVAIEENHLILYKFNIVNAQNIYEEIVRFNLDVYERTNGNSELKFLNGNYTFFYFRRELFIQHENLTYPDELIFDFISKEINDELVKYTYDYQKQFVGVYNYDPQNSYITDNQAFFDSIASSRRHAESYIEEANLEQLFPDFVNTYEIIVSIDEGGFLFIDDGSGNAVYTYPAGGGHFRAKVFDRNQRAVLFHSIRVDDDVYRIYFLNGDIFHEICLGEWVENNRSREYVDHTVALRNYRKPNGSQQ